MTYQNDQISKMTTKTLGSMSLRHLKDTSLIQVPVEMCLRRAKLISLAQVPVGMSLRRLRLVGFIYIPVRHHKDISNRSAVLTYQFRVMMMSQHGTERSNQSMQYTCMLWSTILWRLMWFSLLKVPVTMLLQRLKDIGLIQVPVVTSLRRVKMVSLYLDINWYLFTASPIGQSFLCTNETSQRCLKQDRLNDVLVVTS